MHEIVKLNSKFRTALTFRDTLCPRITVINISSLIFFAKFNFSSRWIRCYERKLTYYYSSKIKLRAVLVNRRRYAIIDRWKNEKMKRIFILILTATVSFLFFFLIKKSINSISKKTLVTRFVVFVHGYLETNTINQAPPTFLTTL